MPPREATNVFPDQYLTLEYDASGPPVMMPHDPTPVAVGGDNLNTTMNGGQDLGAFEQHVNQVMNGNMGENNNTNNTNNTNNNVGGGIDFMGSTTENNGDMQQSSSTNGNMAANSQSMDNEDHSLGGAAGANSSGSSRANVDPLSIDPTSEDDNPMSMPSMSMEFVDSIRPQITPAGSPTSTHISPWSSSVMSLSTPPSFYNPSSSTNHPHYPLLDNCSSPDTIELLRRRPFPVIVSPLPDGGYIRFSQSADSPIGSARRGGGGAWSLVESEDGPRSVRSRQGKSTPSVNHQHHQSIEPPLSQAQNQLVQEPIVFKARSAPSPGMNNMANGLSTPQRAALRRIVSDTGKQIVDDYVDEDEMLSEVLSPIPNTDTTVDSTVSTQDLNETGNLDETTLLNENHIHHHDQGHTNYPNVQMEISESMKDIQQQQQNQQQETPYDLLRARNVLPMDITTPESTPFRNLHRGMHHLFRNDAFDNTTASPDNSPLSSSTAQSDYSVRTNLNSPASNDSTTTPSLNALSMSLHSHSNNHNHHHSHPQLSLAFGPTTKVGDLKYFAERGCIVALLSALHNPRLKTLGCRMLADYAKMPSRRVAVASNKRILQFIIRTVHEFCEKGTDSVEWLGREYAVETIRSLTATEESDGYLMNCEGMLKTLALCARGGPFLRKSGSSRSGEQEVVLGLASGRARLHACIAIMNLSCGKSNKVEIAKLPQVLEAMRDAMLMRNPTILQRSSQTSLTESKRHAEEARLKATTCIKNLSNADANDAALLKCPGLVEALGHVAGVTCKSWQGSDATTTTNACLALMNLSISKANKHIVFRTPGVMDALMAVISQNEEKGDGFVNVEAKVKACSALSNLAIGYDNKIPMFSYPGFVDSILNVIKVDRGEARTKACSILWSFAAEMKNQVPVVRRGDILPVLVQVAEEDNQTEARFKCVAALTLLAESLENAIPLLESGALAPLMDILHEAGPDPTQWKGQTASWCVGFLMNMAQSDEAVPSLREAGVVELLAPLLTLDHYQSLKAAMAVTFVCRYDEGDETYDLLRKTETVIPKIIDLLHNTLSGQGGNGYKYGVFTLRSSVGCIASLASGPDFMKERIATGPVYESLLRVLSDFCVDGGTHGAIVGGGRDDTLSPTLAVRALHELTGHLIPIPGAGGSCGLPFGPVMDEKLTAALNAFAGSSHLGLKDRDRQLAQETRSMILGYELQSSPTDDISTPQAIVCCGLPSHTVVSPRNSKEQLALIQSNLSPNLGEIEVINTLSVGSSSSDIISDNQNHIEDLDEGEQPAVRTFLLADNRGRRFAVPINPSGGRSFNDNRLWCYRRGRFCRYGESPDPNFIWTRELQQAYLVAVAMHGRGNTGRSRQHQNVVTSNSF